jgi:hypothetical protein
MLKKLVVIKIKGINIALNNTTSIIYLALNKYYSKTKDLLALYIIMICDLRYKIKAFK